LAVGHHILAGRNLGVGEDLCQGRRVQKGIDLAGINSSCPLEIDGAGYVAAARAFNPLSAEFRCGPRIEQSDVGIMEVSVDPIGCSDCGGVRLRLEVAGSHAWRIRAKGTSFATPLLKPAVQDLHVWMPEKLQNVKETRRESVGLVVVDDYLGA
jgi:hypothetical protein